MVSAKPSRPLCLAPHQRDNHGHSKRSCDHNECQQVEPTISPPTRAGNFRPIRRDGICRARRTDGAKHFLGQTWTVLTALAVTVPLESPSQSGRRRAQRASTTSRCHQHQQLAIHRGVRRPRVQRWFCAPAKTAGTVSAGSAVRLAFDVLVMTVLSCEGCHSSP